jgi:acyl dehydratase
MYFEDFETGQTSEFGAYEVTISEIKEFASKDDPQFFHLDDKAAKQSLFGG